LSDIPALRAFCFQEVKKMDFFDDGFDWEDWMIIGPMSEDIAEEEKEKERIRRDMFGDDEDVSDEMDILP
jgi:hypothetical protein